MARFRSRKADDITWGFLFMVFVCAIVVAALMSGCSSTTPAPPPDEDMVQPVQNVTPSPLPLSAFSWPAALKNKQDWHSALQSRLLNSYLTTGRINDMESELCPRFYDLAHASKVDVWTEIFINMIRYESAFDPSTLYLEPNVVDRHGVRVTSRGLLQISIESANGYGCKIARESDLHDPYIGLNCGVQIMERLVAKSQFAVGKHGDGRWRGGAAYWAVLRHRPNLGDKNKYPAIAKKVREFAHCK